MKESAPNPSALRNPVYKAIHEALEPELVIGKVVPEDLIISFVRSKSGVKPESFSLRDIDRLPIGEVLSPGKSAHISFTDEVDIFCETVMGQPPRPWYTLVDLPAARLMEAQFYPIYAPLEHLPLHVRVVYDAHLQNPELPEIPDNAKRSLTEIFNNEIKPKKRRR